MRKRKAGAFYAVAESQMQPQSTNKQTILLVEDDADSRRVYSLILRHSGFVVVEAANGGEAVERALGNLPDLILMDMNLPMFDGWEAGRRIKSDPRTAAAPLIAFSAVIDSTADLRRGNALFDGFIAKPVTPSGLVRRVAAYLDLLAAPRTPRRPVTRRPATSAAASAQAT